MSKKIVVLNSPWGREMEPISACQRWVQQKHAAYVGDAIMFTAAFLEAVKRERMNTGRFEAGDDDGIQRRYVNRVSGSAVPSVYAVNGNLLGLTVKDGQLREGKIVLSPCGISVKQLIEIESAGTGKHVTGQADLLTRRQHRRDKGRSVWPNAECAT